MKILPDSVKTYTILFRTLPFMTIGFRIGSFRMKPLFCDSSMRKYTHDAPRSSHSTDPIASSSLKSSRNLTSLAHDGSALPRGLRFFPSVEVDDFRPLLPKLFWGFNSFLGRLSRNSRREYNSLGTFFRLLSGFLFFLIHI